MFWATLIERYGTTMKQATATLLGKRLGISRRLVKEPYPHARVSPLTSKEEIPAAHFTIQLSLRSITSEVRRKGRSDRQRHLRKRWDRRRPELSRSTGWRTFSAQPRLGQRSWVNRPLPRKPLRTCLYKEGRIRIRYGMTSRNEGCYRLQCQQGQTKITIMDQGQCVTFYFGLTPCNAQFRGLIGPLVHYTLCFVDVIIRRIHYPPGENFLLVRVYSLNRTLKLFIDKIICQLSLQILFLLRMPKN